MNADFLSELVKDFKTDKPKKTQHTEKEFDEGFEKSKKIGRQVAHKLLSKFNDSVNEEMNKVDRPGVVQTFLWGEATRMMLGSLYVVLSDKEMPHEDILESVNMMVREMKDIAKKIEYRKIKM